VKINQELVRGQRVQALAAERDRIELRGILRDFQEQLSRDALKDRLHTPYSLLRNAATADALHNIEEVGPLPRGLNTLSHLK
jgi:hypothetical protein